MNGPHDEMKASFTEHKRDPNCGNDVLARHQEVAVVPAAPAEDGCDAAFGGGIDQERGRHLMNGPHDGMKASFTEHRRDANSGLGRPSPACAITG
jgi:hypothetical protein